MEDYIVSGSGTEDDPYILDDDCPYKPFLDAKVADIFSHNNQNISLLSDFGGSLSVYVGNYPNGAQYQCTGSIPNVNSDGNCWIQHISYTTSGAHMSNMIGLYQHTSYKTLLKNALNHYFGPDLYSVLLSGGLSAAYSLTCEYMFWVKTASAIIDNLTRAQLVSWNNAGHGALVINYCTSYHGSWYQTSTSAEWTTSSTVYKPASYYGTGTVNSN